MSDKLHAFRNDAITVTWSSTRCVHAAACVAGLPRVFRPGEKPWIQPDAATADQLAEVVQRCPTGALHFERHDGGAAETPATRNEVRVAPGGPLYLRGDIELRTEAGEIVRRDTRLALCRCGASAHRPLCDGAHLAAGFADRGAIGDLDAVQDAGPGPAGTTLVVTLTRDGSLHLEGPFTLVSADGTTRLEGTSTWLCRCGHSQDKPFCDGSHERVAFQDTGE
jgi:CDGSH-type Zn-finger protein/uncharacterized Fe-S cluster protein YjdI